MVSCGRLSGKSNDPNFAATSADDAELNAAMERARQSLDEVIRVLPAKNEIVVFIKVGLKTTDGSIEHIWVDDLTHENGTFTGKLANEPAALGDLKFGSQVTFTRDQVSDWMIDDGNSIRGNFTQPILERRQGK